MRILLFALLASASVVAQQGTTNGEWRTWGGDLGVTRYAPLDQINKANFKDLEVAWRFKTDALGPRPEYNLQSTPLMVGGVLYSTGGTRRAVVALDAATGEPRTENILKVAAGVVGTIALFALIRKVSR